MGRSLLLTVLAVGCVLVSCGAAHASVLGFFFPSLRDNEPDPGVTLQAPFIEKMAVVEGEEASAEILHVPHRSPKDIGDWVLGLVSEVLTFPVGSFEKQQEFEQQFFSESGWQKYQEFIADKGIAKIAKGEQYQVLSYANQMPLLLNSGLVNGRFRWLYEVPMTVSYLGANVTDYKKAKAINKSFVLRVQVGRVAEKDAIDVMAIKLENWSEKSSQGIK